MESRRTVTGSLKQPKRSLLRRAWGKWRALNTADTEQALLLNDFQVEDVREHTDEEERKMVSEPTPEVFDTMKLEEDMEALDREIRDTLETRMKRKTAVILGAAAIVLFLLGFLPLLFSSFADLKKLTVALIVIAAAAGVLLVSGLVCLFCLRSAVTALLVRFNDRMREFRTGWTRPCSRFTRI